VDPAEHRVLILAPRGRDASLAAEILAKAGMACRVCGDLADLVETLLEGAGAALVTEEALDRGDNEATLLRWVAMQPAWSDFPFIVLTKPRGDIALGVRAPAWFDGIGNVVLLERPIGAAGLASAARAALRARRKQYEMRTHLVERELDAVRLSELNASLETHVAERTAELRAAYDKLAKEAREREQAETMLAQAQRMEALGQLAGGIAHDFNNVLQAVIGGLNLIERRSGNAQMVQQLATMTAEAAQRGASITGRLLAFARRDSLRAEPILPGPLLEGLHEMLAHTLGVGITMRIAADPGLPKLLADKGQLETVLVNLAINARDAMPEGGSLLLTAAQETVGDATGHPAGLTAGSYVRLSVADTGTGMAAATLERASEPFFTTKSRGQGTGLGLAMARGFAYQSGGGLQIESAPGQGTTVTLWLPEAEAASAVSGLTQPADTTTATSASAEVLVVDDDAIVRQMVASQMEELGYHVAQASDGLAALAHLDEGAAVDLLISDFAMPGMNGVALIEEARQRRPNLPALLLTGYADATVSLAIEDGQTGGTALLRKPVSNAALVEHVGALLAKRQPIVAGRQDQ